MFDTQDDSERPAEPVVQPVATKAHVLSISTRYITLELDEPTNLQQGDIVSVSK